MFHRNASKLRLRPRRWLTTVSEPAIYRRLADRTHRSAYASMERETTVHRKQNAEIKLKPSIAHMLLWLRRKQERKLCETTLNPQGLPSSFKEAAVTEVILFHILTCLNSGADDEHWLDCQSAQLTFLHSQLQKRKSPRELSPQTLTLDNAFDLARALEASISEKQASVIFKSLACMALACPRIRDHRMLVPWIRSLSAPRITEACAELANLTYIPACVTSDILLRTPLSIDEIALQLDLWHTFIEPIAQDSHEKRAYVANIIENLLFYTVQFDPRRLEHFLSFTLSKLTSTRSGFHFKVMTHEFVNALIYLLALTFIKNGSSSSSPMPIIKAQKVLVEFLGHDKLTQKGYVGIALLISHESREKATRLLKITKSHFPDHSDLIHITSIYLSNTPEELLHHFNLAIVQYPHSATMWLMLAKKLQQLQLLTEIRSQKLLSELLARKNDIVISKDIILLLLGPIESINGIEDFIHALEKSGLFVKYQNVVLNKYMALLYRYSNERSVHKPYLDKLIRHSSNIECARFLYQKIKWKTISSIGVMLNGEVNHRPGDLYELYCSELQGNIPDEACLGALLRASTKRADGQPYTWGRLYAPQVAVHEFKKYVSNGKDANAVTILASNKLWQVYIHALRSADYTAELAEIMRWWERSSFIPSRSTLMLLLRALPIEFSERHIKHAHSLPRTSRSWPWPTIEDFKG